MNRQRKAISPHAIIPMLLFVIVIPLLPLLITRHWTWWEAWVYFVISVLGFIISRLLVSKRNPDLLAERVRFAEHENVKPWDKLLSPLVGLGSGLIPLVVGLDALFGWSTSFSLTLKILALMIILTGFALGTYALVENRFFSSVVRIQTDRGHQVVSSGPYRWMRHPGYTGGILTYLATPIFLDSNWAFLASLVITILLIVRTALEDRTLQTELEGYNEYAEEVRFRLLPGVW